MKSIYYGEPDGGRFSSRKGNVAASPGSLKVKINDPSVKYFWNSNEKFVGAIQNCIQDFQWGWTDEIGNYIFRAIEDEDLINWAEGNPLIKPSNNPSSNKAWNARAGSEHLLTSYAVTYALRAGMTSAIRPWETIKCPMCQMEFEERSVPSQLIERLGVNQLDICAPCLCKYYMPNQGADSGRDRASKKSVIHYISEISRITGRVPPSDFGYARKESLLGVSTNDRVEIIQLILKKPSRRAINKHFGTWFSALVNSGVIDGNSQKLSRGIRTLALDGHTCSSIGERTIDDLLYNAGIPHEREPRYPDSNYRADFLIGSTFVEYLGLAGNPEYDKKTMVKKELCERMNIRLILIEPKDLCDLNKLETILRAAMSD